MRYSIEPKVGNKVLILRPAYVAGKIGIIVNREILSGNKFDNRWLIQVDIEKIVVSLTPKEFEKIVVSLTPKEFEVINDENEIF